MREREGEKPNEIPIIRYEVDANNAPLHTMDTTMWMMMISDDDDDVKDILTAVLASA